MGPGSYRLSVISAHYGCQIGQSHFKGGVPEQPMSSAPTRVLMLVSDLKSISRNYEE